MIKLYSFGPAFGLVDPSPFVTKTNLFMTINNIEFESIIDTQSLQKAPKKKFPFIDDDGTIVADSMFIFDYLSKKHNIDVDAWMSEEQQACAYLIGKSLEENLYWCLVHSRWINDDTWPIIKERFFGDMPFPLNKIIPAIARHSTRRQINGHGMGAHSNDEIHDIAERSFKSISTLLGNKTFMFGNQISSLDIIVYAQIGAFTLSTLDNRSTLMAKQYENLVTLTQKIQNTYYPNTKS